MNLPDKANETCVAQIAEALFGQPGLSLMEMANRRTEIVAMRAEAERLRSGIERALSEIEDDGPKALKYAAQELRAAIKEQAE